jgi:hypothetical protein
MTLIFECPEEEEWFEEDPDETHQKMSILQKVIAARKGIAAALEREFTNRKKGEIK